VGEPEREPNDPRFVGGCIVWSIVALFVAIPEIWAAVTHDMWWSTISNTTGHLEAYHWWVDLLVVSIVAATALHAVVNPVEPGGTPDDERGLGRTPGGRVTRRPAEPAKPVSLKWTLAYLAAAALLVAGVSYAFYENNSTGYRFEIVMYLSIAFWFIVLPSIAALNRWWPTPFTTLFATLILIQRRSTLFGCVLIAGLAVLLIHLSLYPWPTRCYVGTRDTQHALERSASAQQALDTLMPRGGNGERVTLPDACFKP
jgi:hypothetical protein